MALRFPKVSFGNCVIFALALAEVTSWTIDLPEVRKYFFEENEKDKKYENFKYKNDESSVYYSNIEGNSKHNTKNYEDVYENTAYAREYGYQSYMEKKVNGIVYNGSIYLEGLRRSLENYSRQLEACSRENTTLPCSGLSNCTQTSSADSGLNTTRPAQNTSLPSVEAPALNISSNASRCREVTRTSEHVRRLTELAAWATRELQDVAYARKYKKDDEHSLSMEENELILKLAWFLDRLAHYTGYEPEPGDFLQVTNGPTTTTTTPAPFSLVSPPPDVKRLMMECLKQKSPGAAVDRCRYPEPLPPLVLMLMEMNSNITGIPSMTAPQPSDMSPQTAPSSDPISNQSMELLIASDYRTPSSMLPPSLTARMTAVRNVQKRSVLSKVRPEGNRLDFFRKFKRSAEVVANDPTIHFLKYFAKHKVWEGANPKNSNSNTFETYEIKNHLAHTISKRAIDNKKMTHLKLPEDPFQDISKILKQKPGVNYVKDEALLKKIKETLKNMDRKSPKNVLKKLTEHFRQKRSIKHEKDVDLPRDSEDPLRDISFYTKNKPGRNYNNDLLQALQVRAGLEQVYNTGNIEVVRRFGANYNPLIPDPFMTGILKSQVDFKK